jgi:putative transposase
MAHYNTVFNQLLNYIPRHEFNGLANAHHCGRSFRSASRWGQFVAMMMGQLTSRHSLRDIVDNLSAQAHRLYHLGAPKISRSQLARINEQKPYTLYEALFSKLLKRCHSLAPRDGFRFKNKLYSLDATTLDLCLSVFPWAEFRQRKGAIKLHVGMDHEGYLPEFVSITEGKTSDIAAARDMAFPAHSIVVCDRGYNDYSWFNRLNSKGVFFVTRLKRKAKYKVVQRRKVNRNQGITCDQSIQFSAVAAQKTCPITLRRIGYRDTETGQHYLFLTNHFKLSAKTVADIYKARWQIELFFKWIKQNLKIKSFVGTSKNAVLTQIWIALCTYLLLAYIKFASAIALSMQKMIRLLQLNLFDNRNLIDLLKGDPPRSANIDDRQRSLF